MIIAFFEPGKTETTTQELYKFDFGQTLRVSGVPLPKTVSVQFATAEMSEAVPVIGVTSGNQTDVEIPNSLLRMGTEPWDYSIKAFFYVAEEGGAKTEYVINIPVKYRPRTGEEHADAATAEALTKATAEINESAKAAQAAVELLGNLSNSATGNKFSGNIDELKELGFYMCSTPSGTLPFENTWFYLLVFSYVTTTCMQVAYKFQEGLYLRHINTDGTCTAWVRLAEYDLAKIIESRVNTLDVKIKALEFIADKSKTVDVFICMGQSNMSGRAQTCATEYNGLTENTVVTNHGVPPVLEEGYAWEFRAISDPTRLYPLAEPFGHAELNEDGIYDTAVSGGMIVSFAETYHNITGRNAVYVYASKGGTTIEEWAPNGKLYLDAASRLDSCLNYLAGAGYTVRKVNALWLQGENDAIAETGKQTYIAALRNIVNDLMKNHGVSYLYLCMIGDDRDNVSRYDLIKDAQIDACRYTKNIIMASTILENYNAYHIDQWHYYQTVYNQIGKNFAKHVASHVLTGERPQMYCPHTGDLYYALNDD